MNQLPGLLSMEDRCKFHKNLRAALKDLVSELNSAPQAEILSLAVMVKDCLPPGYDEAERMADGIGVVQAVHMGSITLLKVIDSLGVDRVPNGPDNSKAVLLVEARVNLYRECSQAHVPANTKGVFCAFLHALGPMINMTLSVSALDQALQRSPNLNP